MNLCLLYLTCANDEEATKITGVLLEKKLVFCVKKSPVSSSFLWKGKIDAEDEILLIMDSLMENFDNVNKEVSKIHSYETFTLVSVAVTKTTKAVDKWVRGEIAK